MHSVIQILPFLVVGAMLAGMWAAFTKAGQPGWWAVLPVFNALGVIRACGQPLRLFWLLLVPILNIFLMIWLMLRLARCFGRSAWFGVGLLVLPFVFFPVMGFGQARYQPGTLDGLS